MLSLSVVPLFIISLVVSIGAESSRNAYSKLSNNSLADFCLSNGLIALIVLPTVAVCAVFDHLTLIPEGNTLLFAFFFALSVTVQIISNAEALRSGPWMYTTIIMVLSTLIPTLAGTLFFGQDPITVPQWIGVGLMFVCLFLSVDWKAGKGDGSEEDARQKGSVYWFVCCMIAFLSNGMLGTLQVWQSKDAKETGENPQLASFLFFTFVFVVALCAIARAILLVKDRNLPKKESFTGKPLLFLVLVAVTYGLCHYVNLGLIGMPELPAAVFFPLNNGLVLIMTALMAVFLFHERPSALRWAGMGVGVVAIMLLTGVIG